MCVVSKSVAAAGELRSMTTNLDDNTDCRVTLAEGKKRRGGGGSMAGVSIRAKLAGPSEAHTLLSSP